MNTNNQSQKKVTEILTAFASETTFTDLPEPVVHQTKRIICDTIGCVLGGYSTERGRIIFEHVKRLGGNPESTILGYGAKTSCVNAALANACMGNALDWDDCLFNVSHPAVPIICPALAISEAERVSGKELITAVAIGYDVASRIGLSGRFFYDVEGENIKRRTPYGFSWQVFGGATAAAKILKLDKWGMMQTFSLAAMRAPVPCQAKWSIQPDKLPLSKYADIGWMAQGGITAALLAQSGYTGPINILDGENGFLNMMGADGVDFDFMVDNLAEKWWIEETSLKPWPHCRYNSYVVDPFIQMIEENEIEGEDIEKVIIKCGLLYISPIFKIVDPEGTINMQFSIPHSLANAAFRIPASPRWQYPESLSDPKRKNFRRKVSIEFDPQTTKVMAEDLTRGYPKQPRRVPTTVEITAKGKIFSKTVEYAKGDPWLPETVMTDEELKEKYRSNSTEVSALSDSWKRKTENAITTIYNLETLDNVRELVDFLR
jgi:2-methylcitrate dehydratase PrpD